VADPVTRMRDLALAVAILFSLSLGGVCLAIALWGIRHPPGEVSATIYRQVPPEYGFIAGPIFIGFGVYELAHRIRRGPQPPGRHARSSSR